ncbi:hypothetical protein O0L34_g9027 [Tuta absoluta]|nr:hypothetical protein O0L34_g9027 [Tuta absoluta]
MNDVKQRSIEVVPISEDESSTLKKHWGNTSTIDEHYHAGPKGYFLFGNKDLLTEIYNYPIFSSDIVVASFPRSGTTWTEELVWLIVNDFDYELAKSIPLHTRFMFLENKLWHNRIFNYCNEDEANRMAPVLMFDLSTEIPNRFIKDHLPLSLLPPKTLDTARVVYVARDPRDVIVSNYYVHKDLRCVELQCGFKDFFENLFLKDLVSYTPFFEHVKEAWVQRNHPNMLFLFYEELSQDLKGVAKRVAKFFGKSFTEDQLDQLCEYLKFENFQNNSSVNFEDQKGVLFNAKSGKPMVRKGKVGGWREYFDAKMTQQVEQWMADNLKDTDLRFPTFAN